MLLTAPRTRRARSPSAVFRAAPGGVEPRADAAGLELGLPVGVTSKDSPRRRRPGDASRSGDGRRSGGDARGSGGDERPRRGRDTDDGHQMRDARGQSLSSASKASRIWRWEVGVAGGWSGVDDRRGVAGDATMDWNTRADRGSGVGGSTDWNTRAAADLGNGSLGLPPIL